MTDVTQILLIIVVTVLTTLLTVVGIQVIYILKEFRKTVEKTNKVLDDAGVISESVAKPVESMSGLIMGIRRGLEIFDLFKRKKEKVREERTISKQ